MVDRNRRALLRTLPLPFLATLSACGGGSGGSDSPLPGTPKFAFDGLPGRIVRRLRPGPAGLIAATDDSAWQKTPAGWKSLRLDGVQVQDIAALSATHLLATVRPQAAGMGPDRFVETLDGGLTWQDVLHDFGGPGSPEPIRTLYRDAPAARLLATGTDALAESRDMGRHWTLLAGQWHGFASDKEALAVQPTTGDVWYGGQDAIESLVLDRFRASDGGLDAYPRLLPSPSTAKGIRFTMGEPSRVLVAGEGGIVQTRDNGATWQTLLHHPDYRFHFDVMQDPNEPRRLVSASWKKDYDHPQPLIVVLSENDGNTWRSVEHPDRQLFGGAWSMAVQLDGAGRSEFFFGLYRGGVMRMTLE